MFVCRVQKAIFNFSVTNLDGTLLKFFAAICTPPHVMEKALMSAPVHHEIMITAIQDWEWNDPTVLSLIYDKTILQLIARIQCGSRHLRINCWYSVH